MATSEWYGECSWRGQPFTAARIPGVYAVRLDTQATGPVTITRFLHATVADGEYAATATAGVVTYGGFMCACSLFGSAAVTLGVVADGDITSYSIVGAAFSMTLSVYTPEASPTESTGAFTLRQSCITRWGTPVTSFAVDDAASSLHSATTTLSGGYNGEFASGTGEIDFAAGLGLGVVPCSDESMERSVSGLYSINGQQADKYGHIQIAGDGCFMVVPGSHAITLVNYAQACCCCQDYANVYTALKNVYNKGCACGDSIRKAASNYSALKSDMDSERNKRAIPDKSISVTPAGLDSMNVVVTYRNNSNMDFPCNTDQGMEVKVAGLTCKLNKDSCCLVKSTDKHRLFRPIPAATMFDNPDGTLSDGLTLKLEGHTIKKAGWIAVFFQVSVTDVDTTKTITGTATDAKFPGVASATVQVTAESRLRTQTPEDDGA